MRYIDGVKQVATFNKEFHHLATYCMVKLNEANYASEPDMMTKDFYFIETMEEDAEPVFWVTVRNKDRVYPFPQPWTSIIKAALGF